MAFPTDNCTPRHIQVDESTGCTLTRANILAFKRSDFEAQGYKEVGMDRIIGQTKEARMAGVPERSLTDLMLSRMVPLKQTSVSGQGSVIAPYTLIPRRNTVNANYFNVVAAGGGSVTGIPSAPNSTDDAGDWPIITSNPTVLHPGAYVITVDQGSSNWKTALNNLYKYFLPGTMLLVEWNGAANALMSTQFEILDARQNPTNTDQADVLVKPNVSSAGWAGATQANYQPTSGTVIRLANSISDYESWCYQPPATNDMTLLEYWRQTTRWTHEYDDAYLEALNAPLTSDYFKKFRQLPLVQQRKIQEMLMEKAYYNTLFFGQEIDENQTVEGYTSLPMVEDPNNAGCNLEYKANTLGIRTQLNRCGRVSNRAQAALSLDSIFETCYFLKRNREITSGTVDVIDGMTDRFTAARIRDLMIRYYKSKYSADLNLFMQVGQKVVDGVTGRAVFEYNKYDLPDQGVQLAVFTDVYFDDRKAHAGVNGANDAATTLSNRGNSLWMIDWSDIEIGIYSNNSVKRQTNTADDLYNCVIKPNVKHYVLNSRTFEVRVGDTNRHAMIENFSDDCPSVTVSGCDVTA